MSNVTATPGRGRLCRVTIGGAGAWDASGVQPVIVPHPAPRARIPLGGLTEDEADEMLANGTRAHASVDVVLPHPGRTHMTGAVIQFTDADAAEAFGRAALRAAEILRMQTAPGNPAHLGTEPFPAPAPW